VVPRHRPAQPRSRRRGFQYIGTGVSGGEEGALWGPSIMPGGQREAWDDAVAPIFEAIAAKAEDGEPCVEYMGPLGAGHYVKMVHNGIEYGDMQLIAEIYDLLHRGLGLTAAELHEVFAEWNAGELRSYLIEITADIFTRVDADGTTPIVDVILDEAAQKGTGKWTSQNALDVGAPIPTINAAVESRILSSLKAERVAASRVLRGPAPRYGGPRPQPIVDAARQALYASKITSYAQGLGLLRLASQEYQYGMRPGEVAKIWRAGCIIRARCSATSRPPSRATRSCRTCCSTRRSATPSSTGRRPGASSCRPPWGWGCRCSRSARRSRTSTPTAANACRRT
jgi:6-phosphogluconate dehydrogenase